jgi:uncharacterized protein YjbI with pentapeptide repeats
MSMEQERRADLKRRWSDEGRLGDLLAPVSAFLAAGSLGHPLDLRGAEIGMQAPLADFSMYGKSYSALDLSYGKGALLLSQGSLANLRAEEFQFDRASRIRKSSLIDGRLMKFKGRFGAIDSQFLGCDFSDSTFRGGFNEYGFTRCLFENCVFTSAIWGNTYFKACTFNACQFGSTRFERAYVAGVKITGDLVWTDVFVDCDIRSLYINGVKVAGEDPSAV